MIQTKLFNKYLAFLLMLSLFQSQFVLASNEIIKDELVEATLKGKNLEIEKYKKPYYKDDLNEFLEYVESPAVKDPFIENEDIYYLKTVKAPSTNINTKIENEDVKGLKYEPINVPKTVGNVDFEETFGVLMIKPMKRLTANKCRLGQYVEFQTIGNVKFKNEFIENGTPIIGRITNITENGFAGAPGDITIERFRFKDKSRRKIKLEGVIEKHGANRSVWVAPLTFVGNLFTFGLGGYIFYVIKGGHAKIKTGDNFELEIVQN